MDPFPGAVGPMTILFRYVSREILVAAVLTAFALISLFSFFDFISEMSGSYSETYTPLLALVYVSMNTPVRLYELAPLALLVGGLFAWNRLAISSEFTVMRTGGVSPTRLAGWMVGVGLVVGAGILVLGEYVTPYAERAAQQLKVRATSGVVAKEFQTGLWAKDGPTFINIRELLPDASLNDLRLYTFDKDFSLREIVRAQHVDWAGGHWVMRQVTETRIGDQATQTAHLPDQIWESAITPDLLSVLMVAPDRMSITTLNSYVKHLEENHQASERYRIALWNKMVYPVAAPIMLLLALAFAYRPPRVGGAGGRLLVGVLLGLGFHLTNRLSTQVAQLQGWPPPVAAVAPMLVFSLAAIAALWWLERR